ncbi:MAG: glycoside hydrolase [Gemmatimonadaceae bacterium]|nr:glycoside hydrolase [Gemmatimonadaceae bacterium]
MSLAAPWPVASAQRAITLAVAERANASLSVAAQGRFVAVSWLASSATAGTDAFVSVSHDGGATFGAPVRVNTTAGDAAGGGEMPPRVVLVPRAGADAPTLTVVWAAKREGGTRLLVAESSDGGRHFDASRVLPASVGAGNRGWHSVAVDAQQRVHVLWLDHRDVPPMHRHGAGAAPPAGPLPDPTARAAPSRLHFATLADSQPTRVITGSVCYCCKTALVASGTTLFAAWRHVFPGSQRDIALTVSRDGGRSFTAPRRVHADGWQYDGCPDDGPTAALARDGQLHVVWPSPKDGRSGSPMALFHARTRDGRSFSARTPLPVEGVARHVTAVPSADGVLVVWDESTPSSRRVVLARSRAGLFGRTTFARTVLEGTEGGGYPGVAVTAEGASVAWVAREEGRAVIKVLRVPP